MYTLLRKVLEAKKSCIQEGNHRPSKEDLATRVGITVEKLNKLLYTTRMPLSMQQPVWADQKTTYQVTTLVHFYLDFYLIAKKVCLQFKVLFLVSQGIVIAGSNCRHGG